MKKETECRIPQPKVIRVSEYYPSDKIYEPPCTKLYRCGEDTGCCEGNGRCGAKSSEKVELYFYVSIKFLEFPY
ncbi:hypothetical protein O3M35_007966 [Rhynocoris fuscipes]|uniref:Uncharacterized protein n=1 Tax=Rhynocoris fuscipes TaxID=488301 RepID=A0AAW1DIK6_9HEMI